MTNPFFQTVTVIIAVRNGEQYLRDSIESVLASKEFIHEIIVVDGYSSDRTREIALSFPQIRFVTQEGTGIAGAYNTGIKMASSQLVAFNSHDDLWSQDKLDLQTKLLIDDPNLQIVAGYARNFLDDPQTIPAGFRADLLNPHVAFNMETLLARHSVFALVGDFDEELSTAEDLDWFCRARDLGVRAAIVQEVILSKRIHARNTHLTKANNEFILRALHKSVVRKRQIEAGEKNTATGQSAPDQTRS